jgi:hypothetical protein
MKAYIGYGDLHDLPACGLALATVPLRIRTRCVFHDLPTLRASVIGHPCWKPPY